MSYDPGLDTIEGRRAVVDQVLQHRPIIHYMSLEDYQVSQPSGVWSTDEDCYRFLAERCQHGSITLETGCGISTILFASWGTTHRCITPIRKEADAVAAYCQDRGILLDQVTFMVGSSSDVLPELNGSNPKLDVVLLDGSHGFPAPIIDWYYAARHLRRGGLVVIDDLQLPAVQLLADYLHADPRWLRVGGTAKWAAYERQNEGTLGEDWYLQPFYRVPGFRAALSRSLSRRLGNLVGKRPASLLATWPKRHTGPSKSVGAS